MGKDLVSNAGRVEDLAPGSRNSRPSQSARRTGHPRYFWCRQDQNVKTVTLDRRSSIQGPERGCPVPALFARAGSDTAGSLVIPSAAKNCFSAGCKLNHVGTVALGCP